MHRVHRGAKLLSSSSAYPGNTGTTSTGVPVAFRTTAEGTIEAGVGSSTDVPIEAIEPGVGGNVRANTVNTVSGPLRFRLRVTNPNGTFGGGSELVPVVTQADQDALLDCWGAAGCEA